MKTGVGELDAMVYVLNMSSPLMSENKHSEERINDQNWNRENFIPIHSAIELVVNSIQSDYSIFYNYEIDKSPCW